MGAEQPGEEQAAILLVDDLPANLLALEALLDSPHYRLVKAGSGPEALRAVLHQDFAVILLDVFMPGMDGFEVARLLKLRPRTRHTPIIFVTAAATSEEAIFKGYAAGAIDYLHKPLNAERVRAKVAGLVALYRELQRIRGEAEARAAADKRQLDQRLAELDQVRERRYRNLAESIPPMVWTSHPDGSIDYCNQRWFDYTGLDFEHARGWGWLAVLHPEDRARCAESWRHAIAAGEGYETEVRLRSAADGAYRWHLARALPERGERGEVIAWLGTYTDVDDLKRARAEAEAAREEARAAEARAAFLARASQTLGASLEYEATLDRVARLAVPALADGCLVEVVEPEGQVRTTAAVHADPARAALARSLLRTRALDPAAARGVDHVLRTGRSELYPEVEAPEAAGELGPEHPKVLRQLGARAYLIVPLAARGRILGALTFVLSRAGRRFGAAELATAEELGTRAALSVDNARLYREARQAAAARDEFISVASHELKNPLTALRLRVQGLARALARRGAEPGFAAELAEGLRKLDRQSARLLDLLGELLDLSRFSAQRLRLELEEVDLAEVAREVADALGPELERSGSTLELESPGPVVGRWDRLRLEQVLSNLLANAIKYGAGRPIHLRLEADPERARLQVRDQGIGIARESLQRIFAPYERAVSEGSVEGAGLGLFITRQLVEAHGGEVRVESEPGKGSTFEVVLPRAGPPAPGAPAAHP